MFSRTVKFVRRISWPIVTAAVLLALLATLATLQYRWLGDVSEAERERMRTSLRARASDFAESFDAELTRTYVAFHVDADRLDADAGRPSVHDHHRPFGDLACDRHRARPRALRTQLVEPLVARYFGDARSSEYVVSIVRRDDPAEIVFASGGNAPGAPGAPAVVDARSADVTTGLFDVRLKELNRLAAPGPGRGSAALH